MVIIIIFCIMVAMLIAALITLASWSVNIRHKQLVEQESKIIDELYDCQVSYGDDDELQLTVNLENQRTKAFYPETTQDEWEWLMDRIERK